MRLIDGIEGKILKKYSKGKVIEPQDEKYLERMASTGLIKYGFDLDKRRPTAKTTLLGYYSIAPGLFLSNYLHKLNFYFKKVKR